MAHSPSPRISQFFRTLRTPGHRRGVLVRRAIALALLIAALVSAISRAKELPQVLVFSHDLPAGAELSAEVGPHLGDERGQVGGRGRDGALGVLHARQEAVRDLEGMLGIPNHADERALLAFLTTGRRRAGAAPTLSR